MLFVCLFVCFVVCFVGALSRQNNAGSRKPWEPTNHSGKLSWQLWGHVHSLTSDTERRLAFTHQSMSSACHNTVDTSSRSLGTVWGLLLMLKCCWGPFSEDFSEQKLLWPDTAMRKQACSVVVVQLAVCYELSRKKWALPSEHVDGTTRGLKSQGNGGRCKEKTESLGCVEKEVAPGCCRYFCPLVHEFLWQKQRNARHSPLVIQVKPCKFDTQKSHGKSQIIGSVDLLLPLDMHGS